MAAKRAPTTAKSKRVFGQSHTPAKMFRVGLYARVSTHNQKTLPLLMRVMRESLRQRSGDQPKTDCKITPLSVTR